MVRCWFHGRARVGFLDGLLVASVAFLSSCEDYPPAAHALEKASRTSEGYVREASAAVEAPVAVPSSAEPEPAGADDAPGLQANGLKVVILSPASAKVVWTTPQYSDSEIRWGRTERLEETPILQPDPTLTHTVLLTGLTAGQTYHVQAVSRTAGDAAVESEVLRFETIAAEDHAVRKGHPRLFFTSDDVAAIRKKIASTHAKPWADLKRSCESSLGKDAGSMARSGSNSAHARALAFAGFFGDDARYKKKAEDIALECTSLGGAGNKMDVRLRVCAVTAVYDWLHADLSESVRAKLRNGMLEMYDRLESDSNDRELVWGHSHGNSRPMLLIALSLAGEDRRATESVGGLLNAYRDGFFATWRNYGDDGGSLKGWWYTTWTLNMELEVLAAVKSATSLDWYKTEAWYGRLVDWYLMGLRGDGSFLRSGDSRISEGLSHLDWEYALSVAHFYRNPRAKWLAQKIGVTIDVWGLYNIFDILWNDADLAPEAPSGHLSRLYRTPGHVLLRDSWGPEAVVADFRSAQDYTLGHTHLDNNSFTIFCRGGLALDSGIYDEFASSHHANYYRRTIAHNSILVSDPDERFVLYGTEYSSDGGQKWLGREEGLASSFPARVEDVLDPSKGFRAGGILVYDETPEYTYALGDAAPSYSTRKLSTFDRHFLWLTDVAGRDRPVIVVFDQVVSKKPGFEKTYLLHTQNRPSVQGSVVSAVNKGGVLFQETILPEAARIEVVGGPGKEFWVDGKNYPPARDPTELEEVGAWRVEVSPSTPRAADQFLHVLHANEAGRGTAPKSANLSASSMYGCTIENWVVLFGTSRRGTMDVGYAVPKGAWKHLLVGLVPNATYEVSMNGDSPGRVNASDKGSLRFDSQGVAKVQVTRVADAAPKTGDATPLGTTEDVLGAPADDSGPEVATGPITVDGISEGSSAVSVAGQ